MSEKTYKIGLVGCGVVGRGLVELMNEKKSRLGERYGFDFRLCLVSDYARGTLLAASGLDMGDIVRNLKERNDLHEMDGVRRDPTPLADLLAEMPVDILCDATPTNYETGQPSLGILEAALMSGADAVTCSKGGVGIDLPGLKRLAAEKGAALRFESSVLSGTPLIDLVRGPLAGCEITRVEGILNGTTNYILTKMEEGMDYAEALREAQRLGYAETDPTGDVEGFDAAVKVCIMAAEFFERHLRIADVDRTGITQIEPGDIERANAEGKRIKLIAGVARTPDGGVAGYVKPTAVDRAHPLAGVMGVTNAATLHTDNLGEITIIGPGAGARETAQGLLSDMLEIASKK